MPIIVNSFNNCSSLMKFPLSFHLTPLLLPSYCIMLKKLILKALRGCNGSA